MSKITLFYLCLFIFSFNIVVGQETNIKIYDPLANASEELNNAIKKAKDENKHVLTQIGGNWCHWCLKFHKFCAESKTIDSLINANYVLVKINYSKDNKNLDVLERLEFPQRFGYPVFVVLDRNGKRLHTQNSWYLELEKGYDEKKIITFLKSWSTAALDPKNYK